jgi:hypothetical protein
MLPIQFKEFYAMNIVDLGYYNPDDPMAGLVNCPGLICMKTNQPMYLGIVTKEEQGYVLWDLDDYDKLNVSDWDYATYEHRAFLSGNDFLIDSKLPAEHKNYFRAINLYRRIFPENTLVRGLLDIYRDGGLLTQGQRTSVDDQLFLGSDAWEVICNFQTLRTLDVLAALGPQPGLDQSWVQEMMQLCKTESVQYNDDLSRGIYAYLERFAHLIKPLSEELVSQWPPEDRVLSLE